MVPPIQPRAGFSRGLAAAMASALYIDESGVLRFSDDTPRWWPSHGATRLRPQAVKLPQDTGSLCLLANADGSELELPPTVDPPFVTTSLRDNAADSRDHALVRAEIGELWRPRPIYDPLADVCIAQCPIGFLLEEKNPRNLLRQAAAEPSTPSVPRPPRGSLPEGVADCLYWLATDYAACGADKAAADGSFLLCVSERIGDPLGVATRCESGSCRPEEGVNAWWLRVLQAAYPRMDEGTLTTLARELDCDRFMAAQSSCACNVAGSSK